MRKLNLLLGIIVLSVLIVNCTKEKADREKIVEMTIYPETGYGASVMSEVWTEPLIFSDSDDSRKQMLVDIIIDNFNLDYERGYAYKLKMKKVWMKNPPQDVSSIKYEFIELVSKEKAITEDSETIIELLVSPQTVKFTPRFPIEYSQIPKIYNALKVNIKNSNTWLALTEIEGFNYEAGYEYELSVKKVTKANPYAVKYVLLAIVSKKAKS